MRGYYDDKLSGEALRRCYEIASPRVKRYLEAEIRFLLDRLSGDEDVLELGCGYGRVAFRLAEGARQVVGIDNAGGNLLLARRLEPEGSRCRFLCMDAVALAFRDCCFDSVVCVQNGISAFGVPQDRLLREALRVTRPGGSVILSTYSPRFWKERLGWFEAQSEAGLLGEIDYDETGDGVIACRDGFRSGQVSAEGFRELGAALGVPAEITEVDGSSLFCVMRKPEAGQGRA